jgi:acetyl esterase/lipase
MINIFNFWREKSFQFWKENQLKLTVLNQLWLNYVILQPIQLKPSIGDSITRLLHNQLPLNFQHNLRDRGYIRFLFDASVGIAALFIALLNPTVTKNFLRISATINTYKYGLSQNEIIEVIRNDTVHDLDSTCPVLVFVHGGAWGSGQPWMYRLVSDHLMKVFGASHVAIVGYQVYPSARISDQTKSLYSAINFIHSRLFQSSNLIICGHSSGANISALCLLKYYSLKAMGYVKQFVGISGVYDISKHYLWEKGRGVHEISPMKAAAGNTEPGFVKYSPTTLLSQLNTHKAFPHAVLIHCENDDVVPVSSSVEFALGLSRRGFQVDYFFPKVNLRLYSRVPYTVKLIFFSVLCI